MRYKHNARRLRIHHVHDHLFVRLTVLFVRPGRENHERRWEHHRVAAEHSGAHAHARNRIRIAILGRLHLHTSGDKRRRPGRAAAFGAERVEVRARPALARARNVGGAAMGARLAGRVFGRRCAVRSSYKLGGLLPKESAERHCEFWVVLEDERCWAGSAKRIAIGER